MSRRLSIPVAFTVSLFVFSACSGSTEPLRPVAEWGPRPCPGATAAGEVEVQFLGTAGFKIRWGDEALLTGPYFSNPSVWDILFGRPVSNDRGREAVARLDLSDVGGVIVGQAHYDHLADVPLVAPRLPADAKIFVSRTGRFLLEASGVPSEKIVELNTRAGNWRRPGEWLRVSDHIRIMALHSEHAPHLFGMKFLEGKIDEPLTEPPLTAGAWLEGQTFSFVIDLLDAAGQPAFRFHYQDSATNAPWGFPPPFADGKRTDAAIICVASFTQVKDYPEAIVRDLRPRHVVLAHWDNFFRPQEVPLQALPGLDTAEFVRRLGSALPADGDWVAPELGGRLKFSVCAD